jgi:anti-sigma factor RsiW
MCDMARSRLIAWMDGELEGAECGFVQDHIAACAECAHELRHLRTLSRDITGYCDAVGGEKHRRYWIPAAAAAAVVLATGLLWMRGHPAKIQVADRLPSPPAVLVARTAVSTPPKRIQSARPRLRVPLRTVKSVTTRGEPGVTVVIPLDEVLPFGAAPPGAVLVGNLTFDAGGRPSRIQLQ